MVGISEVSGVTSKVTSVGAASEDLSDGVGIAVSVHSGNGKKDLKQWKTTFYL